MKFIGIYFISLFASIASAAVNCEYSAPTAPAGYVYASGKNSSSFVSLTKQSSRFFGLFEILSEKDAQEKWNEIGQSGYRGPFAVLSSDNCVICNDLLEPLLVEGRINNVGFFFDVRIISNDPVTLIARYGGVVDGKSNWQYQSQLKLETGVQQVFGPIVCEYLK